MESSLCVGVLVIRMLAARTPDKPFHTFIGLLVGFFQMLTLVLLHAPLPTEILHKATILAFPFMHLSVKLTDAIRDYSDPWPSLGAYICKDFTSLFLWTFLLSCLALVLTFSSRDRVKSYKRLSMFNSVCIPDAPLAVSALFCEWSSGQTYWNATFSFATSMQWTVFSLFSPAIFLADSNRSRFLPQNEFKESFFEWNFAIKGELVAVVYFEHFASVWFTETPGLRIVLLLFTLYIFKKVQEIYWPYKLREANIVAEDCFWSVILAVIWRWFQQQWILYVALLLPCRQLLLLRSLFQTKLKP